MKGPITAIAALAVGAGVVWGGIEATVGAVSELLAPPPARVLELQTIEISAGEVRQHILPRGADSIAATWAAKFTRADRVLCAGSGGSNYTGAPTRFTPSEWVGRDCPEIRPGDMASATWEWRDDHGHVRSMSVRMAVE